MEIDLTNLLSAISGAVLGSILTFCLPILRQRWLIAKKRNYWKNRYLVCDDSGGVLSLYTVSKKEFNKRQKKRRN